MVEAAISKMKTKPLVATGKFSIGELAAAMSAVSSLSPMTVDPCM